MKGWKLVDLVRKARIKPSGAKYILLEIALHVGANEGAWPTVETLADNTGMSQSAVKANTKRLRAEGLIQAQRRFNKSNVYTINEDALRARIKPGRQPESGRTVSQNLATNTHRNTQENTQSNEPSPQANGSNPVESTSGTVDSLKASCKSPALPGLCKYPDCKYHSNQSAVPDTPVVVPEPSASATPEADALVEPRRLQLVKSCDLCGESPAKSGKATGGAYWCATCAPHVWNVA